MTWQDIVLSVVSISFTYSLIPQIIYSVKKQSVDISWQTLIITSIGLLVMAVTLGTINLNLTAITTWITSFCWFILLFIKIEYIINRTTYKGRH